MKLLLFGVALLGVVLLIGLLLPSKWSVTRALLIQAPPDVIYGTVATLRTWPEWSPWNKHEDPTLEARFEGPETGVGAGMQWSSAKMGTGGLRLALAEPGSAIRFELAMSRSSFAVSGLITLAPEGTGTRVTWTDSGDVGANLPYRYFLLALKPTIGGHIEKALGHLKERLERAPVGRSTPTRSP